MTAMASHLRWMLRKRALRQDMLLLGPPPSTHRRHVVQAFARACGLGVEEVVLTGDTTEADLKQRRELRGGRLEFRAQGPVRAAREGRVLLLDGLERAERNVLPSLNNLLENREMNLDDGTRLVHHERFLALTGEHPDMKSFLEPVHPDFIVVALALPVPPFSKLGRPLDPPLRSRFQARMVMPPTYESKHAGVFHYSFAVKQTEAFLQAAARTSEDDNQAEFLDAYRAGTGERVAAAFPHEPVARLVSSVAPFLHRVSPNIHGLIFDTAAVAAVAAVAATSAVASPSAALSGYTVERQGDELVWKSASPTGAGGEVRVTAKTATAPPQQSASSSPSFRHLQASILQDLVVGKAHVLLVGEVGSGKTHLVRQALELWRGQDASVRTMPVTRDTTARDLLVRRAIDPVTGDSVFVPSVLVDAATRGDVLILDGVERLEYSVFVSLARVLAEGDDITLPDGKRITPHPSFRVVALASGKVSGGGGATSSSSSSSGEVKPSFLFPTEVTSCFMTHVLHMDAASKRAVLEERHGANTMVQRVLAVSHELEKMEGRDSGLSLRQMFRLVRLCEDEADLRERVESAFLSKFMPTTKREAFDAALARALGVSPSSAVVDTTATTPTATATHVVVDDTFTIPRFARGQNPELIPVVRFHDNASHSTFMRRVLKDFGRGERDFIALGAQGVGKNKVADRMCELLGAEREYIQLHRDSTVASIVMAPAVEEGKVVYRDSPLVRAAKYGRVLLIDEADKAPAEVLGVLKSLVEDGEMPLGDGRWLVRRRRCGEGEGGTAAAGTGADSTVVQCHEGFCIWILANRPGFPFLGNDFTRALGDVFSVHVLPNPDRVSELALLQSYGPDVPTDVLDSLATAFAKLRHLNETGVVSYPFSTRDAVAVVKHLQGFPSDGLLVALENVMDFDQWLTPNVRVEMERAFHGAGIPFSFRGPAITAVGPQHVRVAEETQLPGMVETERWVVVSPSPSSQRGVR